MVTPRLTILDVSRIWVLLNNMASRTGGFFTANEHVACFYGVKGDSPLVMVLFGMNLVIESRSWFVNDMVKALRSFGSGRETLFWRLFQGNFPGHISIYVLCSWKR